MRDYLVFVVMPIGWLVLAFVLVKRGEDATDAAATLVFLGLMVVYLILDALDDRYTFNEFRELDDE